MIESLEWYNFWRLGLSWGCDDCGFEPLFHFRTRSSLNLVEYTEARWHGEKGGWKNIGMWKTTQKL